jgi:bifunctional DNase/RNase
MAMIKVKVDGLALDVLTNSPVVILSSAELDKVLPIWIGHAEAWAIAMELSKVPGKRPMTHDLLKSIITTFSVVLDKVEITELKNDTFYARLTLRDDGQMYVIDARPSDSIALALKMKAPIFANDELFKSDLPSRVKSEGSQDGESLADRLKKINPEDFGQYSL